MSQSDVFDSLRLRNNLKQAVIKNCRIENRADGVRTLCFRNISGVEVSFDPQAMRKLSAQLYELIPLGGSLGSSLLANHMMQVAIIASHLDLAIFGEPPAVRQIELLKRKITTDFALVCALSLAHDHEYSIRPEITEWEVMHSALSVKDDDSLLHKFKELLSKSRIVIEPSFEVRFPPRGGERVLSAESYANLASLASVENWDSRVVLTLIEEHLSPTLRSGIAFYSNTVSSEEWRQLYDNICKLLSHTRRTDSKHRVRDYCSRNR